MRGGATGRELAVGLPACLVGGLLVGALGAFKHQVGISAATGTGLPVGLVLSVAMVALLLVALRLSFPSRWFVLAAAVGVVVGGGLFALPGPGGSTVVLLNVPGVLWLVAPALIGVLAVGWPRRRRSAAGDGILTAPAPSEDRTPK